MKNNPDGSLPPRPKTRRFMPNFKRNAPKNKKEVKGKGRVEVKSELSESKDDFVDEELMRKLHNTADGSGMWPFRTRNKVSSSQVTFEGGDPSKAKTFGEPKGSVISANNEPPAAPEGEEYESYDDIVEEVDYNKYYPTSLPLTRPESESTGSHAIKEFGEGSICPVEETCVNAARELGLMQKKEEPELIFFQLPANLPLWKRPAAATDGNEPKEPKKGCRLHELPGGLMGKLRVYKSGIIKLKLGDSEFDVSPGAKAVFAQEVAAINIRDRHCCILGEVTKGAVITPNVDSLLDTIDNMNTRTISPSQVTFEGGDPSKAKIFGEPKSSVIRANNEPQAPEDEEYESYDDVVEEVDYNKYYPTSLPLTRPESESTGSHTIKELGEASICPVEETCVNAARELGFMEEKEEPELIFFQLPANLPLWKRPAAAADEKEPKEPKKGCKLDELPGGLMGKLRVYKSGMIKLKLGDSEFDVSPGAKAVFAQEVAAINIRDRHCCILGEVTKRAVITPNVDSLLDTIDNMNTRKS